MVFEPPWPRAAQVSLQGIPDIRKVFIREAKRILPSADAPDGYSNDSEWMLDTEGVNLLQVPAPPSPCCLLCSAAHARCVAVQLRPTFAPSAEQWPWRAALTCCVSLLGRHNCTQSMAGGLALCLVPKKATKRQGLFMDACVGRQQGSLGLSGPDV